MSTDYKVALWFDDGIEANAARIKLIELGIIEEGEVLVHLQHLYNTRRGWGFTNLEQGTMAKIAVGK